MPTSPRSARAACGLLLPLLFVFTACTDEPVATPERALAPAARLAAGAADAADQISTTMDAVNAVLDAQGAEYRVAVAEYITSDVAETAKATVIAKNVGNKQLGADFVPGDSRRAPWSGSSGGDDITYAIDRTGDAEPPFGGLSGAATTAAIQRAMTTWDDVRCSTLPLRESADFGLDLGVIAFIFGLGGSPFVVADLQHAGWRDINFAGGIIGATFTFIFIDPAGQPTDIDNNGKLDVAFREIYYDPSFAWGDGTNIDVETVALHEAGHGLSQAHFGTVSVKNGQLKLAPAAVMNAIYGGVRTSLAGTDNGGHCSNWANWPNT